MSGIVTVRKHVRPSTGVTVRKHQRGVPGKPLIKVKGGTGSITKKELKDNVRTDKIIRRQEKKTSKRYAYEGPEAYRKSSLHAAEVAKLKRMRDRHVVRQAKKGIDYWKGEL